MDIKEVLIDFYSQFLNSELTVDQFASSQGMTREQVVALTKVGRQLVNKNKDNNGND